MCEFERSSDIQKIGKLIIKALAAFAEDCLSLRSKRVPQVLQVPAYLQYLERKLFGYFLVIKSNMNKKVNKIMIE